MSAVAETLRPNRRALAAIAAGLTLLTLAIVFATPSLMRSKIDPNLASLIAFERSSGTDNIGLLARLHSPNPAVTKLNATLDVARQTTRTSTIEMIVKSPVESSEHIRELAESMGGFLVSSESRGHDAEYAAITIRVPAASFEEARAQIKKYATRVETEVVQANDVTRAYVDMSARLRNLRAQEAQYLEILKRATTVKDTLAVSDKLGEVRSEIEQQQAEFDTLSKQVETVAMTVSLHSEAGGAEAQLFGFHWRPIYRIKLAARAALEALADYTSVMTAVIMFLPVAFLWSATVLAAAVVGWRLLRWVARFFVPARIPAPQP
jgi:uncharacterized protein DUF4349